MIPNRLLLLQDSVLTSNVGAGPGHLEDSGILHAVVLLVQVHSQWQHLLDISKLDLVDRTEVGAVVLDAGRVLVKEAPHINLIDDREETSSSLDVQRAILLHWVQKDFKKIGPSNNVSLEADSHGNVGLDIVLNVVDRNSDLLLSVSHVVGPHKTMSQSPWSPSLFLVKDQVNIRELLPSFDAGSDVPLSHQLLQGVIRLSFPNWINVNLLEINVTLSLVVLPQFLGMHLQRIGNLRHNVPSVHSYVLVGTRWRP